MNEAQQAKADIESRRFFSCNESLSRQIDQVSDEDILYVFGGVTRSAQFRDSSVIAISWHESNNPDWEHEPTNIIVS